VIGCQLEWFARFSDAVPSRASRDFAAMLTCCRPDLRGTQPVSSEAILRPALQGEGFGVGEADLKAASLTAPDPLIKQVRIEVSFR
jgi:hypothetical protein